MKESLSKKENNEGREYLLGLEKTGLYVFHGSPDGDIQILEPRQAHHVPDLSKPKELIPDGEPAVSATWVADFAIFRALINRKNTPPGTTSGFGFTTSGEKEFRLPSEEIFESLRDKVGFVYVFKKSDFAPYSRNSTPSERSMEWRAASLVSPVEVVRVSYKDIEHLKNQINFSDKINIK